MSQDNSQTKGAVELQGRSQTQAGEQYNLGKYLTTGGGQTQLAKEQQSFGKELGQQLGGMQAANAAQQASQAARGAGLSRGAAALAGAGAAAGNYGQGFQGGLASGMGAVQGGQAGGLQTQSQATNQLSNAAGQMNAAGSQTESPWQSATKWIGLFSDTRLKEKKSAASELNDFIKKEKGE